MNLINKLSAEQELLILSFIKKWEKIAFSTMPTNKSEIERAIWKIYSELNLAEPIIYYCNRPTNTQDVLDNSGLNSFGSRIHSKINELLFTQIEDYLRTQIIEDLWKQLEEDLVIRNFDSKPFDSLGFIGENILDRLYGWDSIAFYEGRMFARLVYYGLVFDYCQVVVDLFNKRLTEIWNLLQVVVNNCSQIFFYEHVCIVYEKLEIISVDDRGLLHNDGKPGIEFRDGTKIYACHGATIPEEYGKIPFDRWQVSWLSKADLRQRDILISGIGEARICQELKSQEKINKLGVLTPQQKLLIPQYRKKWQNIVFSGDKLNADSLAKYINRAYKYLKKNEIEICIFDNPFEAQQYAIDRKLKGNLRNQFIDKIYVSSYCINPYHNYQINHPVIHHRIISELEREFQFENDCDRYIKDNYRHKADLLIGQIRQKFGLVFKCLKPELFMVNAAIQDYLLDNFNCDKDTERMEIFVGLMSSCGWIYPYREVCLVCDRQFVHNNQTRFQS